MLAQHSEQTCVLGQSVCVCVCVKTGWWVHTDWAWTCGRSDECPAKTPSSFSELIATEAADADDLPLWGVSLCCPAFSRLFTLYNCYNESYHQIIPLYIPSLAYYLAQGCPDPVLEGWIQPGFPSSQADNGFQQNKWEPRWSLLPGRWENPAGLWFTMTQFWF